MAEIIVGTDGLCTCNCADKCACRDGNTGMGYRCSEAMIREAGHHPVKLLDEDSDRAVRDYMCIDGKEKRIKATCTVLSEKE